MFSKLEVWILLVGACSALYLLFALIWSIAVPEKRIWPPKRSTTALKLKVWTLTVVIFLSAFLLGVLNWNALGLPAEMRWGLGLPLILIGNLVVWRGVIEIGLAATSGEVDKLEIGGLYRWSRNPQYIADMAILAGWGILSATFWVLPVIFLGWLVLLIAPFSEEHWLEQAYGNEYRSYSKSVRRFL